jgi:hypothetical protein
MEVKSFPPVVLPPDSAGRLRSSYRRWPFELDDIAFRIRDVDGRTLSFRTVARFRGADDHSSHFKRAANAGFVERFYPKAKMIEISPFSARRGAARTPQLAVDWHEVNQGSAGPQLDQTYRILPALDRASQHITVKMKHLVQINHAQYQVINFPNANHWSILIQYVAARTDSEIRVDRDHAIVELHRVLEC